MPEDNYSSSITENPASEFPSHPSQAQVGPSLRNANAFTACPHPNQDPSKLNVLIVEDNLVNQHVLQKVLQKRGFTAQIASHGVEALEVLQSSSFWTHDGTERDVVKVDIVLMDLWMPLMNGLDCTRVIRGFEGDGRIKKHVPIIGLTADVTAKMVERMSEAGMVSSFWDCGRVIRD
jgi:CheY-like chemotaxis protein